MSTEKQPLENASGVDTGKNTKEEAKGNKNNKTVDADKLKATADKVSSTFFPGRKIEELENLKQFGKEALPYLTEIGKNSRSPRVKKKIFDIMDKINQSEDKDEQEDVKEFEDA